MKGNILLLAVLLLWSTYGHAQHWKDLPFQFNQNGVVCLPDTETDSMYIIGSFTDVNGLPANVVQWDGDTGIRYQSVLGGGGYIDDITTYQGKTFACAGGVIQRKDVTGWHWTHNPQWDQAYQFFHIGDRLTVMMEHLDSATGFYSNHLCVWDGPVWKDTLRYDTLNQPNLTFLSSIAGYNGQLYLGSNKGIIRFDGTKWANVGGGIFLGGAGYIAKLQVWHGELYACGSFFESEGAPGNDIARWDGTSWRALGTGLLSEYGLGARDMLVYNDELYVVGSFSRAGGINADGIAKWDGKKWCAVNDDFGGGSSQIIEFKGKMYVSGGWNHINGSYVNNIAKWVGGVFGDSCSAPLSVNNPAALSAVIIYPNPASDAVFIGLPDIETVSIYDMQGSLVNKTNNYVPRKGIRVSMLSPGIYMLRIETKSGITTRRFVKD